MEKQKQAKFKFSRSKEIIKFETEINEAQIQFACLYCRITWDVLVWGADSKNVYACIADSHNTSVCTVDSHNTSVCGVDSHNMSLCGVESHYSPVLILSHAPCVCKVKTHTCLFMLQTRTAHLILKTHIMHLFCIVDIHNMPVFRYIQLSICVTDTRTISACTVHSWNSVAFQTLFQVYLFQVYLYCEFIERVCITDTYNMPRCKGDSHNISFYIVNL